jgi:hypothetical protein
MPQPRLTVRFVADYTAGPGGAVWRTCRARARNEASVYVHPISRRLLRSRAEAGRPGSARAGR